MTELTNEELMQEVATFQHILAMVINHLGGNITIPAEDLANINTGQHIEISEVDGGYQFKVVQND